MSFRFMRVIVFFDLPVDTVSPRRSYRKFRKFLIRNGFIMMQESVYARLLLHTTGVNVIMTQLKNNKPADGLVQVLTVTEKQFSRMVLLGGTSESEVLNTTERLVFI